MLQPIRVSLAPYDPNYPHEAARLTGKLRVLGSCLMDVHHIGSTAVPGLIAKPILDSEVAKAFDIRNGSKSSRPFSAA